VEEDTKIPEKTSFMLKILPIWKAHIHEGTAAVPELKRSDKVNVKPSMCLIMQQPVKALSGTEGSIDLSRGKSPFCPLHRKLCVL